MDNNFFWKNCFYWGNLMNTRQKIREKSNEAKPAEMKEEEMLAGCTNGYATKKASIDKED